MSEEGGITLLGGGVGPPNVKRTRTRTTRETFAGMKILTPDRLSFSMRRGAKGWSLDYEESFQSSASCDARRTVRILREMLEGAPVLGLRISAPSPRSIRLHPEADLDLVLGSVLGELFGVAISNGISPDTVRGMAERIIEGVSHFEYANRSEHD